MSKLALVVFVVACGGGGTPKPSTPAPTPPASPDAAPVEKPVVANTAPKPAACVKADASVVDARVVGDVVVACYTDSGCWALDPATGSVAPHAALPASVAQGQEATVDSVGIKVCAVGSTDCKTIATKEFPDGGSAAVKDDGSLVAVATTKAVTVFDVAKGTKLARIPGWKTPMSEGTLAFNFVHMQFLGDNLAVWETYSPVSSAAKLFAPRTGKHVADIAGKDVQISEREPAHVDGATWAFVGFDYNNVFVQDMATGKLVAKYDLGKIEQGAPGAWIGRVGDYFVVESGEFRAIDTRSKVTKTLAPPFCP